MKKKIPALLLSLALAVSCAACGSAPPAATPQIFHRDTEPSPTVPPATTAPAATEAPQETPPPADSGSGLTLRVDGATGEMTISRPEQTEAVTETVRDGWTVFVYLCGTDLESDAGLATDDVQEMLDAEASEQVRFVIQAGGARRWFNDEMSSRRNGRFLVENGEISKVDETERTGMGKSSTLADFLTWGVENYAAEHMALVFWNHGGGSISGVCFDEQDRYDSLSLRELDAALLSVHESTGARLSLVGFDACLMGTVEMANILASYADYLVGSQETEPGSGWDYVAIGDYLAENPDADGAALGRVICDSFLASCEALGADDIATLSVIDLTRVDELLVAFNRFAEGMYTASEDASTLSGMVRGIESADNFGGNNRIEGYTNMVDLGGLISACSYWTEGADEALAALDQAVVYTVSGVAHPDASGLSVYYPLCVQGSQELTIFTDLCVSPYYLSFVDRQSHGSISGETDSYDGDTWFTDGVWESQSSYTLDDDGYYDYEWEEDSYWGFINDFFATGESPLITFEYAPQLDEDGTYWFMLDDDGWYYAADVYAYVYELSMDGEDLIELGETYDILADWDYGYFCDDFDGYWLSLPDGQNLATYIVEITEDHIIYTSPILLNGESTYLRLRQNADWTVVIEGAWNGIDEYGAADRDIIKLKKGDVITPLYYSYAVEDFEEGLYSGWDYTFLGRPVIYYDLMESGDYLYAFCIDDIFGDYYMTEFVMFSVDDYGNLYFYPD